MEWTFIVVAILGVWWWFSSRANARRRLKLVVTCPEINAGVGRAEVYVDYSINFDTMRLFVKAGPSDFLSMGKSEYELVPDKDSMKVRCINDYTEHAGSETHWSVRDGRVIVKIDPANPFSEDNVKRAQQEIQLHDPEPQIERQLWERYQDYLAARRANPQLWA